MSERAKGPLFVSEIGNEISTTDSEELIDGSPTLSDDTKPRVFIASRKVTAKLTIIVNTIRALISFIQVENFIEVTRNYYVLQVLKI